MVYNRKQVQSKGVFFIPPCYEVTKEYFSAPCYEVTEWYFFIPPAKGGLRGWLFNNISLTMQRIKTTPSNSALPVGWTNLIGFRKSHAIPSVPSGKRDEELASSFKLHLPVEKECE